MYQQLVSEVAILFSYLCCAHNPSSVCWHRMWIFCLLRIAIQAHLWSNWYATLQKEYDDYLAYLLDGHVGQHQVIHDQIAQLTEHGRDNTQRLETEIEVVQEMEQKAKRLLEENERLGIHRQSLVWLTLWTSHDTCVTQIQSVGGKDKLFNLRSL